MGKREKRAYLEAIRGRYSKSGRAGKAAILDEFCAVCGFNRKYAIRLLGKPPGRPERKPGKKPVYDSPELLAVLRTIWLATDQMCSKKLKAAIPLWLPHFEAEDGKLAADLKALLLHLSAATIDRLLKPVKTQIGKKGLCGTKPGTLLKTQIPIRTHHWDITQPGFMEADTVAHCGNSLAGNFVWSLTLTDIHSSWTECRAVWNKGAMGIVAQIRDIEARLPFAIQGFDCDNGSEFLNHHLLRYFAKRPVQFTRSRPYKKNDNAHVEQKNWSHVRQLLGYDRLEDPKLVDLINALYVNEWSLYQNHFCPTMKLQSKERLNSKYRKRYSVPQTPLQRLLDSPHVSQQNKKALKAVHQTLNPFKLKHAIEQKLRAIFQCVRVTSNVRQRI